MTGQTFGRLTPVKPTDRRKRSAVVWLCRCTCGNMIEAFQSDLVRGSNLSCGCLKRDLGKKLYLKRHHVDGTCIEALEKKTLRSDNSTGYIGVSPYKGKYRAYITLKGKRYYLGTFETIEEAAKVREQAKEDLHGEFLKEYYLFQANSLFTDHNPHMQKTPVIGNRAIVVLRSLSGD